MSIDFLITNFKKNKAQDAIVWYDKSYSYGWLLNNILLWDDILVKNKIKPGSVVVVRADFSPRSTALLFSLIKHRCIFIPITNSVNVNISEITKISQSEFEIIIDDNDDIKITKLNNIPDHKLYYQLKKSKMPGLVLFSSGSTGKSKASLHDITSILDKFKIPRHRYRAITFLLYDHIGGINTLFYILSNGGTIVTVQNRTPSNVLETIEKYKVELLPTSPTFINLILISEEYKNFNLSTLKIITYGTEPMLKNTLDTFNKIFPDIKLLQTYGLSEVGILRSKSKSSNSLWMKIGGEGFETRVVDDMLEIKAKSAMLGYLNAPSPFTKDGWFRTGDQVVTDGDYFKILGRNSEIINVGGEKVYPQVVENIISQFDFINDVEVYKEKNPIIGNIVCAKVHTDKSLNDQDAIIQIKKHCSKFLKRHEIPMKIKIVKKLEYSKRFKKIRSRIVNESND
tara:strand:- start:2014 stop:3378 length:1365 start_codon:yes stop_codon:yes gene_type:complete